MKVYNETSGLFLAKEALTADSLLSKSLGLIFSQKGQTLILKTRFGVHTFGLKFPIDVAILDQNSKVVDIKKELAPNKIFFWNPKYSLVIETAAGILEASKTKKGDKISLSP